ncbi:MAG: hypothetical protein AB1633_03915 [Elusimicrobiota bacterium]
MKNEYVELDLFGNIINVNRRLETLENFIDASSDFISRKILELSPIDSRDESLMYYINDFGNGLRKSFVVTLSSFIDVEIGSFCEAIKRQKGEKTGWNDLKGTVIERFVQYTTKVIEMKLSVSKELWREIDYIIAVGNCVMRFGGKVTGFSDSGKLKTLAQKHPGLIIMDDSIIVTPDFCKDCIVIIQKFFETIYNDAIHFLK